MKQTLQLRYTHADHTRVVQDMRIEQVGHFNFWNN